MIPYILPWKTQKMVTIICPGLAVQLTWLKGFLIFFLNLGSTLIQPYRVLLPSTDCRSKYITLIGLSKRQLDRLLTLCKHPPIFVHGFVLDRASQAEFGTERKWSSGCVCFASQDKETKKQQNMYNTQRIIKCSMCHVFDINVDTFKFNLHKLK